MSVRRAPPSALTTSAVCAPPELTQARAQFRAGEIDADTLRAAEDEAILGVIALQREAGLRTVTDGEFRRSSWHMDFIYSLGGVEQVQGESIHVQFRDAAGAGLRPARDARQRAHHAARDDLR